MIKIIFKILQSFLALIFSSIFTLIPLGLSLTADNSEARIWCGLMILLTAVACPLGSLHLIFFRENVCKPKIENSDDIGVIRMISVWVGFFWLFFWAGSFAPKSYANWDRLTDYGLLVFGFYCLIIPSFVGIKLKNFLISKGGEK